MHNISPYQNFNRCAKCKLKFPKDVKRCDDCGGKLRSKSWLNKGRRQRNSEVSEK